MTYRVNDIFYSLQGEGHQMGRAAVFVRFSGCNLRCPFCDTDFTAFDLLDETEIVRRALTLLPAELSGHKPIIVLTGGEPSLQVNADLINAFHSAGFSFVAMESNGTHCPPDNLDWLTVSPKRDVVVTGCDELKVIFDGKSDPGRWDNIRATYRYLQPCDVDDEAQNRLIVQGCIDYIKRHPQWRLSAQVHKLLGFK